MVDILLQRRIVIAITGGIAAYKCAELVRRLKDRGAEVRVVMTASACEFITPLTMQALSGEPVHTHLLDPRAEQGMGHIELARWAELVLVVPATAHTMARLAHGWADDLLGSLWLATTAIRAVAPAMNQQMWKAPAVQRNYANLLQDGVRVWGPTEGQQACGDVGPGRMMEPMDLVEQVAAHFQPKDMHGLHVLLTAGPTQEKLDPVRYLSNYSSGLMGYCVAKAFQERGAHVTLVSGPVSLPPPQGVTMVSVVSAAEMLEATLSRLNGIDVFVGSAAVADYRPRELAQHKIKKTEAELTLKLEKTEDILARVAEQPNKPFVVGFAAETQHVHAYALDKMKRKKLDMIACNDVSQPGIGFAAQHNAMHIFWKNGDCALPKAPKMDIARQLVGLIMKQWKGPSA
ncbi:MAG: bifunctional phosphopantothenoylcysteine decarboxylase/phosphopantothenate--cysteine ligase CoaBC [Pseudomonadales bacterium]|nr:bifunctional phosphopantothenoylcysteine decarboxylase/phosphopantothenate--cysteine ligase CoaBC [Pseudomonadales bacterium]